MILLSLVERDLSGRLVKCIHLPKRDANSDGQIAMEKQVNAPGANPLWISTTKHIFDKL